jgi:hypothetical protein
VLSSKPQAESFYLKLFAFHFQLFHLHYQFEARISKVIAKLMQQRNAIWGKRETPQGKLLR